MVLLSLYFQQTNKKTKKVLRPSFQELICNREAVIELLIFVITDTFIMIL